MKDAPGAAERMGWAVWRAPPGWRRTGVTAHVAGLLRFYQPFPWRRGCRQLPRRSRRTLAQAPTPPPWSGWSASDNPTRRETSSQSPTSLRRV